MMICKKCGAKLNDGVEFCMACGEFTEAHINNPSANETEKNEDLQEYSLFMDTPQSIPKADDTQQGAAMNQVTSTGPEQFNQAVNTQPNPYYSQQPLYNQNVPNQWMPNQYPQQMPQYRRKRSNNALIIISIVLGCFVLLSVIGGYSALSITRTAAEANFYAIGKNSIPSIKSVLGARKISGVSTKPFKGVERRIYTYSAVEDSQSDITKYINYLRTNDNFILITDYYPNDTLGSVQLGCDAKESGEIVLLKIDWNRSAYSIAVMLGKGTLHVYKPL